eukprot:m.62106 g.62106  ORF g.62106 m.62106 type:complete len:265 (-) comp23084_c0_seq2:210-1004(-)
MSRFSKTLQYHCLHTISTHIKPSPQNVTPTNDLQIRLPPNIPMCTKTLILDFLANRGTLSDDEMEILLSNSTKSVDVRNCSAITDRSVMAISVRSPSLKFVDLSLAPREPRILHEDALIAMIRGCPGLQQIVLSRVSGTTDKVLEEIGRNCKSLQSLSIADCENVTDVGIAAIVDLPLTGLNLNGLTKFTDKGCSLIAQGAMSKTIEVFQICKVQSITDEGVCNVIATCHQMHSLLFQGCRRVGFRTREKLSPSKRGSVQWTVY